MGQKNHDVNVLVTDAGKKKQAQIKPGGILEDNLLSIFCLLVPRPAKEGHTKLVVHGYLSFMLIGYMVVIIGPV